MKEQYNDEYGERTAHNLHTSGRILLNIWRAMQTELKLPIYNREACCAAVLRTRVPEVPHHVLAGAPLHPPRTCVRHSPARDALVIVLLAQIVLQGAL